MLKLTIKNLYLAFTDLNVAWFAAGNQLDVVSTTHNGVQSRRFQCSQGQEFEVMCVASIPNEQLALVGLSSSTGSGAVALYNYHTSLILKSWSVSHKVKYLHSKSYCNACTNQIYFSGYLCLCH